MRRLAMMICAILLMADLSGPAFAAGGDNADAVTSPDVSRPYTLASGDKLKITVFNVASLSGEYAIDPGGEIALPLLGNVKAAGKSVDGLTDMIRGELANGFVNDPKITIEVLNYSPYYILGEVNKPGQFPFVANVTVEQAVATAGGYTYRAARREAYLRHPGGSEQLVKFRGNPVYIQPGDTIRIGERYL